MPGSGCLAPGRGLSPPAWGGGAAWGCFWEKSALMWGGCLLQADFGALFPLCFFPPCAFTCRRAPRALQLPAGAHWCGTWGSLLSLDLCPVSVCSSSLGGKTTSLPLPFSVPLPWVAREAALGRWAVRERSCGSGHAARGLSFPGMSLPCLREPWGLAEHQAALCVCAVGWGSCAQADEVCKRWLESTSACSLWSRGTDVLEL